MQVKTMVFIGLAVLAVVALIVGGCNSGPSGTPTAYEKITGTFQVNKRVFAWSHTLDIVDGANNYGRIEREWFTWTRTFTYYDGTGAIKSKASARFLTWGAQVDVRDGSGNLLGTFKEEVFDSLFKTFTTYSLYDAAGKKIATSKKTEFFSTEIVLYDNDGRQIARLYRPAFNWPSDKWEMSVSDRETVDLRVLLMISAYKSSVDADRRSND